MCDIILEVVRGCPLSDTNRYLHDHDLIKVARGSIGVLCKFRASEAIVSFERRPSSFGFLTGFGDY